MTAMCLLRETGAPNGRIRAGQMESALRERGARRPWQSGGIKKGSDTPAKPAVGRRDVISPGRRKSG
jgi:hypothetical protein